MTYLLCHISWQVLGVWICINFGGVISIMFHIGYYILSLLRWGFQVCFNLTYPHTFYNTTAATLSLSTTISHHQTITSSSRFLYPTTIIPSPFPVPLPATVAFSLLLSVSGTLSTVRKGEGLDWNISTPAMTFSSRQSGIDVRVLEYRMHIGPRLVVVRCLGLLFWGQRREVNRYLGA